ncbi:uncharacterized protein LOC116307569 [Actinia tenebrosa]|uniref:Uncharacterized protein LOC116307569 n=1 Tax=Actinia tenebrosa TaxID=6105 RepID=A0A6P8J2A5_ACTTE|nr:uncharacterized protein LOC116307569 [Actinia tenebrosa]
MESHYTDISINYDYLYEPFYKANVPIIIDKLQLIPDDLLLDIGAATGQQAHLVWKQVGLKNPVTCLEPCQGFFEHACKLDGIVPVMQGAEQFCDHLVQDHVAIDKHRFNKVLLFAVAHHFDNIPKVLTQIFNYLPTNGICAIINHPSSGISLPFTAIHVQHFAETPDFLDDIVSCAKSRDDVITKVTNEKARFRIPKSRWYYMIRNRFWSSFRRYTDEEIEESVKELDNGRFKDVKDDELIDIVDTLACVQITKK